VVNSALDPDAPRGPLAADGPAVELAAEALEGPNPGLAAVPPATTPPDVEDVVVDAVEDGEDAGADGVTDE